MKLMSEQAQDYINTVVQAHHLLTDKWVVDGPHAVWDYLESLSPQARSKMLMAYIGASAARLGRN